MPKTGKRAQKRALWAKHLERWRSSGLSQRGYCAKHGLAHQRFAYWHKHLGGAASVPVPAPEFIPMGRIERCMPVRIRLAGGAELECTPGTDPQWIAALAGALAGAGR